MIVQLFTRSLALGTLLFGLIFGLSVPAQAQSVIISPPGDPNDDLIDFNGDGYGDLAIGSPRDILTQYGWEGGEVHVLYGKSKGLSNASSQYFNMAGAGSSMDGLAHFGHALAAADYNGDSYTDLAVGAPGKNFGELYNVGQVNILYGSSSGLILGVEQAFSQMTPGIEGAEESGDEFGQTLAAGDFNGDGYADLAVGVPYESYNAGDLSNMGAVNIIYGSASGLSAAGDLIIHPALPEVDGTPGFNAQFGYALDTGDFDNDGRDDLAVGIPLYELANGNQVGAVQVFYGSPGGVSLLGEQLWRQGIGGIPGAPEQGDRFGAALAAGDFDNNGTDDLAIGVPGEGVDIGNISTWDSGAVHILYGYSLTDGLSGSGDQLFYRGLAGINGNLDNELFFGGALATADFDGNGVDDLAVGVHGDSPRRLEQGSVQVFYSNGSLLSTANQDIWYQGILGGKAEIGDRMGYSLGTADFNGDGYADLAAGVPAEDLKVGRSQVIDAGAVNIIYGAANGLVRSGNWFFHQGLKGIPGPAEEVDFFGIGLTR